MAAEDGQETSGFMCERELGPILVPSQAVFEVAQCGGDAGAHNSVPNGQKVCTR
jgi:hypothetical protein